MRLHAKILSTTCTIIALVTLATSSAHARRLFFSSGRFQAIWTLVRWEVEGTVTAECPVTLEGSFHSASLSKVSGTLIGYLTSAKVRGGRAECNNTGTARVNTETLPWHIQYNSFTGMLPNITGIRLVLVGADFNVDPEGFLPNCRVRGTQAHPGAGTGETAGAGPNFIVRTFSADTASKIPLASPFCEIGGEADFRGTAEVFVQGSTTSRILVRLVQ